MLEAIIRELCHALVTVACMLVALAIYDRDDEWRQ